jgi:hypothetical protein
MPSRIFIGGAYATWLSKPFGSVGRAAIDPGDTLFGPPGEGGRMADEPEPAGDEPPLEDDAASRPEPARSSDDGGEESPADASLGPGVSIETAVEELEAVGEGGDGESPGPAGLRASLTEAVADAEALARTAERAGGAPAPSVPADVRAYDRFSKMDRATYDRVNEFLRDRTYITAREWAIARLCADFRTATGVEMTKIGEHLPELVPFMTDTYSPQAVNQARSAFEGKVRKSGATFLYGAMSGFFTADELDDVMYEVTEVAKFLLEVEGVDLAVDEELATEERISSVMREVRQASEQLRHDGLECPECGHHIEQPGAHAEVE